MYRDDYCPASRNLRDSTSHALDRPALVLVGWLTPLDSAEKVIIPFARVLLVRIMPYMLLRLLGYSLVSFLFGNPCSVGCLVGFWLFPGPVGIGGQLYRTASPGGDADQSVDWPPPFMVWPSVGGPKFCSTRCDERKSRPKTLRPVAGRATADSLLPPPSSLVPRPSSLPPSAHPTRSACNAPSRPLDLLEGQQNTRCSLSSRIAYHLLFAPSCSLVPDPFLC
jgi:hypothetical protein